MIDSPSPQPTSFFLCGGPNSALEVISYAAVAAPIAHSNNDSEKSRFNPVVCTGLVFYSQLESEIISAYFLVVSFGFFLGCFFFFSQTGLKTSGLCKSYFLHLYKSNQLSQWQMDAFPQAEKLFSFYWSHLLKTAERKGQKVRNMLHCGNRSKCLSGVCLSQKTKLCLCPERRFSIC